MSSTHLCACPFDSDARRVFAPPHFYRPWLGGVDRLRLEVILARYSMSTRVSTRKSGEYTQRKE